MHDRDREVIKDAIYRNNQEKRKCENVGKKHKEEVFGSIIFLSSPFIEIHIPYPEENGTHGPYTLTYYSLYSSKGRFGLFFR